MRRITKLNVPGIRESLNFSQQNGLPMSLENYDRLPQCACTTH